MQNVLGQQKGNLVPSDNLKSKLGELKTSQCKHDMLKRKATETNSRGYSLHSIKPPKVPKDISNNTAIIPDISNANPGESYSDKIFEERLQIDPSRLSEIEKVFENWTEHEIEQFKVAHSKFKLSRLDRAEMPSFMKERLQHKTSADVIKYFYLFYLPFERKIPKKQKAKKGRKKQFSH